MMAAARDEKEEQGVVVMPVIPVFRRQRQKD
jgi:hypothetical protein